MHPEISIILLTALAGMGQGLFTLLVAADVKSYMNGAPVPPDVLVAGAVVSIALAALDTLASFFHLAHKARGWKAMRQWRVSWLSREVILLPAFQGLAFLYALAAWGEVTPALRIAIGAAGVITALALYMASGMIYAAVRFIREWNTAYTPINFALIGLASGATAAVATFEMTGAPSPVTLSLLRAAFMITVIALVAKLLAYNREAGLYYPTIQTALGINHPEIRLSDMGSSYGHYNTKEYHYTKLGDKRGLMKNIVILGLYVAPLVMMTVDYIPLLGGGQGFLALPVAALMLAVAFMERWLFFAEGNHAQNLYYGNFTAETAANPLLQSGRKTAPLPRR